MSFCLYYFIGNINFQLASTTSAQNSSISLFIREFFLTYSKSWKLFRAHYFFLLFIYIYFNYTLWVQLTYLLPSPIPTFMNFVYPILYTPSFWSSISHRRLNSVIMQQFFSMLAALPLYRLKILTHQYTMTRPFIQLPRRLISVFCHAFLIVQNLNLFWPVSIWFFRKLILKNDLLSD